MVIKLVSCSCVDNMQYYDAIISYPSVEFSLTSVYYNVRTHVWSVKFPDKPLFETVVFSELISYLTEFVRDMFYR